MNDTRNKSRSLALYEQCVRLYPAEYRREHGPEMIQNFEDLERESRSIFVLWSFAAKDLLTSLIYQRINSLTNMRLIKIFPLWVYVVGVVVAWAIVLFAVSQLHPANLTVALSVGAGFLLGMLAMYIAVHVYRTDLDK